MVVLFFFAITGYNLDIIGFNYNAFIFFGIGSYVGIRQMNIIELGRKFKVPILTLTLGLIVLFIYLRSIGETHYWLNSLFFICFFMSLVVVVAGLIQQGSVRLLPYW